MKKFLIVSAMIVGAASVRADDSSAFQASLTPDVAIHAKTRQINGLSLNIWGENPQAALSIGLVNGSTGDSKGLSWALFNYDESYTGIHWGLVNYSKQNFTGWQGGIFFCPCVVNISEGTFTGLQEGIVNCADEFHGLQLGVVNYSKNLHGVQIGVVNIAMNNGWFKDMPDKFAKGFPIVNWSF